MLKCELEMIQPNLVQRNTPPPKSDIEMIPFFCIGMGRSACPRCKETSLPAPGGADISRAAVVPSPRRLEESKETSVSWHTTLLAKSSVLYLCEGDEGRRRGSAVPVGIAETC